MSFPQTGSSLCVPLRRFLLQFITMISNIILTWFPNTKPYLRHPRCLGSHFIINIIHAFIHPSIQGPSHHSYLEEHVGREGMQISGALRIRRTLPSFPSSSTSYEVISHYYHGLCRLSQFALRPSFSLHPRFLSCLWRHIVRWQHLYDSNRFPC